MSEPLDLCCFLNIGLKFSTRITSSAPEMPLIQGDWKSLNVINSAQWDFMRPYTDGVAQECSNALELLQSCIKHRYYKLSHSESDPGTQSNHYMWIFKCFCSKGLYVYNTVCSWWRHQMWTFSALLAICAGNSPVPVNSPHKGQWRGALMFLWSASE